MSARVSAPPSRDEIEVACTEKGGFTQDTLAKWGIPWPPPKGWRKALLRDRDIPPEADHPIERPCPTCEAEPGEPCEGKRGHRKAYHRARGGRRRSHPMSPIYDLKTESPIERSMAAALRGWIGHHEADATLQTQVSVGPYRADILIESGGCRLAVECDGVAYHNSREAIERDKRRDRYFATKDIAVMRFTGPEIVRDPRGCAAQVGLWIRARR